LAHALLLRRQQPIVEMFVTNKQQTYKHKDL
jgi:hypothetical protein